MSTAADNDLDPRIQGELESLNAATDVINNLEIELEEAKSTFRILMNESTRRLKLLTKKLGNCIEKSRPYYEALTKFQEARIECQKSAIKFQRASETVSFAKETVALAEQRFMSNSHEWQFDNAWQEMLNHATQKVMDAELQKTECHAEHQKLAQLSNVAEIQVQQLEERFRRLIIKSRPYFEEKQICNDQLETQKNRITQLEEEVSKAKKTYSTALKNLEQISEEIHRKRGDFDGLQLRPPPPGPRIPGVGAEFSLDFKQELDYCHLEVTPSEDGDSLSDRMPSTSNCANFNNNTNRYTTSDSCSEIMNSLSDKTETLSVRSVEGADGQQVDAFEDKILKKFNQETINKLLPSNSLQDNSNYSSKINLDFNRNGSVKSLPFTPEKCTNKIKTLQKLKPLPSENVSLAELPILSNISNEILEHNRIRCGYVKQRRKSVE